MSLLSELPELNERSTADGKEMIGFIRRSSACKSVDGDLGASTRAFPEFHYTRCMASEDQVRRTKGESRFQPIAQFVEHTPRASVQHPRYVSGKLLGTSEWQSAI